MDTMDKSGADLRTMDRSRLSDPKATGVRQGRDGGGLGTDGRSQLDLKAGGRSGADRGLRDGSGRGASRDGRSDIVINGSGNNVYINSSESASYPRPYEVDRYHTRVSPVYINRDRHWNDCGWYFSLNWSHHSCGSIVSFRYDPWNTWGISYYYPNYHRKYVFCSLGGYWPSSYRYRRYYWYGCHPYRWYGSYVIDQPVVYDTYSTYNTYNTYNTYDTYSSAAPAGYTTGYTTSANNDYYYDPATEDFSDVREKMKQQAAAEGVEDSPMDETTADACFAKAVDLFAQGKYEQAVFKLRVAMILDPEDVVLPFAYLQALFAAGDYENAAAVLRMTLKTAPDNKDAETVYYPRGLYEKEEVLHEQISKFAAVANAKDASSDYKLLLGYQLLGSGRLDEAVTPLNQAVEMDIENSPGVMLIDLLEKIKADQAAAAAEAAQVQQGNPEKVSQDTSANETAKKEDDN